MFWLTKIVSTESLEYRLILYSRVPAKLVIPPLKRGVGGFDIEQNNRYRFDESINYYLI